VGSASSDRRGWSDEQLRDAVASQTSWRGVLRALGLRATSAGAARGVKRHAERLQLSTTHFTGQRGWSDRALAVAVAQAGSWSDVLNELGLGDRAESRARIKGRALRLGLDVSHLNAPIPDQHARVDLFARRPEPSALRHAAPSIAMAWFTLHGAPVALPVEPQEYDLLVTMPSGIQRVQVKSTTCRVSGGKWQVSVGRRPYALDKSAGKACYDPDSIDYFFVVNGEGAIYLIPISVVAGLTAIYLDRYFEYKVGDASSLLASTRSAPGPPYGEGGPRHLDVDEQGVAVG